MSDATTSPAQGLRTPLYFEHIRLGARMVPFAGYEMPVQYQAGIIEEHLWTRAEAGLFDISHMGQAILRAADGRHETVARALESLVPAGILGLAPAQQRYTQLLNDRGGIIDDIMVTRPAGATDTGTLRLVLNASRKEVDCAHIRAHLPDGVTLEPIADAALIALQGPKAAAVMSALWAGAADLGFMEAAEAALSGARCFMSRSGYTGEDGYEISVPAEHVVTLWQTLLASPNVRPCGLGARDSLRLEAGLCLYGHELDETTSPVEANLSWSIQKQRRTEGGFPGAERVLRELSAGPERLRVGILPSGRAPARDGTEVFSADGAKIGRITSGGYAPSLKRPVALATVDRGQAVVGTPVKLAVRGAMLDAEIVKLPFVPHSYHRR